MKCDIFFEVSVDIPGNLLSLSESNHLLFPGTLKNSAVGKKVFSLIMSLKDKANIF